MAPLLRRTWAPRGQTPRLVQHGGQRQKVSLAAALWMPPRRDHLGLTYRTLVNAYFNNTRMAMFLAELLGELDGRWVVVWDGGPMHKGDPIRNLLDRRSDRICLEPLPPYAPMLNPVEHLWSWLKYDRLCNFAPHDAAELNSAVIGELRTIEDDEQFLRNLFHASELPMPRALLS
ncbi:MAG: transposase [Isosphaeraceae bacterium]|jgi:transposase